MNDELTATPINDTATSHWKVLFALLVFAYRETGSPTGAVNRTWSYWACTDMYVDGYPARYPRKLWSSAISELRKEGLIEATRKTIRLTDGGLDAFT